MKTTQTTILTLLLAIFIDTYAYASPSRVIVIPSTDSLDFLTLRGELTTNFRSSTSKDADKGPQVSSGSRDPGIVLLGSSVGVLPFTSLKGELGVEYTAIGPDAAEDSPVTFNAKVALPQGAIFTNYFPAVAAGVYNYGTNPGKTNQNIAYGLMSYRCVAGRFTAGGYHGGKTALGGGDSINYGLLAGWDRAHVEINRKFWTGIDYMGGKNVNSSVNFGAAIALSKSASIMVGYNLHTNRSFSGGDTIMLRGSWIIYP